MEKYLNGRNTGNQDTVLILNKQFILWDTDTASSWEPLGLVCKLILCMTFLKKKKKEDIHLFVFLVLYQKYICIIQLRDLQLLCYSQHIFMTPESSGSGQII